MREPRSRSSFPHTLDNQVNLLVVWSLLITCSTFVFSFVTFLHIWNCVNFSDKQHLAAAIFGPWHTGSWYTAHSTLHRGVVCFIHSLWRRGGVYNLGRGCRARTMNKSRIRVEFRKNKNIQGNQGNQKLWWTKLYLQCAEASNRIRYNGMIGPVRTSVDVCRRNE